MTKSPGTQSGLRNLNISTHKRKRSTNFNGPARADLCWAGSDPLRAASEAQRQAIQGWVNFWVMLAINPKISGSSPGRLPGMKEWAQREDMEDGPG